MFLGLDLGTTNVKAVVVDTEGRVVADGSAGVERYYTADGGVEQDLEEIWHATCSAIRQAIADQDPLEIAAIGVSSQGAAMQLLDAEERPVGRVISWLDGRGRPFDEKITAELGEDFFVEHVGRRSSTMTLGQILRLRARAPKDYLTRDRRIGYVGDCIVGRLCGRRAHDPTSLSIAGLLNPALGKTAREMLDQLLMGVDDLLAALPPPSIQEVVNPLLEETTREMLDQLLMAGDVLLPDLLPATSFPGRLLPLAAHLTGLTPGKPVSPAVHDQYAATIGAGSVEPGDVCLGTGTAWVILANTPALAPPVTEAAFVCPHPVEGIFGQMLSMVNGGSSLDWAMSLVGRNEPGARSIDDSLEAAPPAADGLHFWPLLSPSGGPGPFDAPGGRLTGLTLAHTPDHLIRAVVEGLACELARHLKILTDVGLPVRRLVMCGAAAASRATPQIVADVTGRPVACVSEPAVSALGAATIARALVEPMISLADLARTLAPTTCTVVPGANQPLYRELFEAYLEPFSLKP